MDRARRALVPGAVAALVLVSGCTATNPQLTHTDEVTYNPSDGINVAVGPIRVQSLMVVSGGGQAPGALVARLVNTTLQPHRITMTGTGGTTLGQTFTVPATSTLAIGPDQQDTAVVDPVGAQPGQVVHLAVSADGGASQTTPVPVLTGTLPEYATLVPTPTPTATSASATSAASGTPTGPAARVTSSRRPVLTGAPSSSPPGGATPSSGVKLYSPGGTPTG